MARGLAAVARDVRGGDTLGGAMRKHSALFDDANVELIAFAEEAGRLEPVCAGVVSHLEKVQAQRWQAILGALWPMYLGGAFIFVGPLLGVAQQVSTSTASIGPRLDAPGQLLPRENSSNRASTYAAPNAVIGIARSSASTYERNCR